jgi:hypothetical protein
MVNGDNLLGEAEESKATRKALSRPTSPSTAVVVEKSSKLCRKSKITWSIGIGSGRKETSSSKIALFSED